MVDLKPEYIEARERNPYMSPMVLVEPDKYKRMLDVCEAAKAWATCDELGSLSHVRMGLDNLRESVRALTADPIR